MTHFDKVLRCIAGANDSNVDSVASFKEAVTKSSSAHLLGKNAREKLEVDMWLTFSASIMSAEVLSSLNATLLTKTYLVGNSVTVADHALFVAVSAVSCAELCNIARWFNHIRSLQSSSSFPAYPTRSATLVPVPVMDGAVDLTATKTPVADAHPLAVKATAAASATPAPTSAAASVTAASKADKAEDSAANLDPTRLDIRCGLVVKCWNHPDSDKLLCEEVDLGGGDVRQIASGIRAFYSADQLLGRKVVVLANLKERSIAGFKSQVSRTRELLTLFAQFFCLCRVLLVTWKLALHPCRAWCCAR
jgi:methionine--tRNA ligase beta chain